MELLKMAVATQGFKFECRTQIALSESKRSSPKMPYKALHWYPGPMNHAKEAF